MYNIDKIDKIICYIMVAALAIGAICSGILSWVLLSAGTPGFVFAGIVVALAALAVAYLAFLLTRVAHTE